MLYTFVFIFVSIFLIISWLINLKSYFSWLILVIIPATVAALRPLVYFPVCALDWFLQIYRKHFTDSTASNTYLHNTFIKIVSISIINYRLFFYNLNIALTRIFYCCLINSSFILLLYVSCKCCTSSINLS